MHAKNTMTPLWFLLGHVAWAIPSVYLYKQVLFRCLENHTLRESQGILLFSLVGCELAGMFLERKRFRNGIHIFWNLTAGFGLYTAFAYFPIEPFPVAAALWSAVALCAGFAVFCLVRKFRPRKADEKPKSVRHRIHPACTIYTLFAACFAALLLFFGSPLLVGNTFMSASVAPSTGSAADGETLAGNIDTILLLQEDQWEGLSLQKRLDVLQTVANIERRYLGLPHELNVGTANMEKDTGGFYVDKTHEIVINLEDLRQSSPDELLNTVCHEAYHGYEHRLADLYNTLDSRNQKLRLFHSAASYAEEFQNHPNAEEDFYSYYSQDCEKDARAYAEDAVIYYYTRIEEYLSPSSNAA